MSASQAPQPAPQDPHTTRLQRRCGAAQSVSAVIKGDENQQCHKGLWNPLVRLCTHVGVHTCVYTSTCVCMCVSVFAHVCCGSLMFMCACVYTCVRVCTCACVYTHVHTHMHVCDCVHVRMHMYLCVPRRSMQGLPF